MRNLLYSRHQQSIDISQQYQGRWFLNKLATHILAFEGGSHVEWFEGNYQDYELDKKNRLGDEALNPKRLKYKPILR